MACFLAVPTLAKLHGQLFGHLTLGFLCLRAFLTRLNIEVGHTRQYFDRLNIVSDPHLVHPEEKRVVKRNRSFGFHLWRDAVQSASLHDRQ